MPTSADNQQITIVLSKELVKKLDALANHEVRTRSQQAAKIIKDFFENQEMNKALK